MEDTKRKWVLYTEEDKNYYLLQNDDGGNILKINKELNSLERVLAMYGKDIRAVKGKFDEPDA